MNGIEKYHTDFERALERCFGHVLPGNRALAENLWGSLTNTRWRRVDGEEVFYSFRAANQTINDLGAKGEWYMSTVPGIVSPEVEAALAREGWRPVRDYRSSAPRESVNRYRAEVAAIGAFYLGAASLIQWASAEIIPLWGFALLSLIVAAAHLAIARKEEERHEQVD